MKLSWSRILVATLIMFAAAFLLTWSETVTEINTATGSMRTRDTVAGFLKGAWKESPTWVSQRAQHLGIETDHAWQFFSRRLHTAFIISRGCGKAPASYHLKYLPEEEVPEEQRDDFVRHFAGATEAERKAIHMHPARGEPALE